WQIGPERVGTRKDLAGLGRTGPGPKRARQGVKQLLTPNGSHQSLFGESEQLVQFRQVYRQRNLGKPVLTLPSGGKTMFDVAYTGHRNDDRPHTRIRKRGIDVVRDLHPILLHGLGEPVPSKVVYGNLFR